MSKYTITLDRLLKSEYPIGLDKYPIFNEEYRQVLNDVIIEHYRFREIGFQNPAIFVQRLNTRMTRIMRDKYNPLYEAKSIEFNPLFNIDITETFERQVDNEQSQNSETETSSSGTSSGTDTARNISSQYPNAAMLADQLPATVNVDNMNRNDASNSGSNSNSGNATDSTVGIGHGNENYEKHTVGSSAGLPFSRAMIQLKEFYDRFDLDAQVIDELSDLFMNIW